MSDANVKVTRVLERLVDSGEELGLQVAAYLDGELVIDAWAGPADEASGRMVDGDTLFPVFSSSKGPTATCIHILAERGKLFYDEPIAKYWPEFAAKGKQFATIRHALTHRVGVPNDPVAAQNDPTNWDAICAEIADTEPQWEPGTRTSYHGTTFGWILGEVLRRADGRPIERFLQEEVCVPLGIDSMFFGIPDAVESRVATLKDDIPGNRTRYNLPQFRRGVSPAGGGIMNARSLARMYAALANGGELDGVRVISADRLRIATELQTDAIDGRFRQPIRKALGYWLGGPGMTAAEAAGPNIFGHAGSGGSIGFADPERNYAFAFAKNALSQSATEQPTGQLVERAVEEALGILRG
jgi:CubicO group peptidase (beta-lactamase class C family)